MRKLVFPFAVIGLTFASTPTELAAGGGSGILVVAAFVALMPVSLYLKTNQEMQVPRHALIASFSISAWFLAMNLIEPTQRALSIGMLAPIALLVGSAGVHSPQFKKLLSFVLMLNIFAFLLQLFLFLVLREIIPLHTWLFPFSNSRVFEFFGVPRLAGIHNEPGTYSNWVYILAVMRLWSGGKVYDKITILSMLTMVASLSAWASIAFLVYVASFVVFAISRIRSRSQLKRLSSIFFAAVLLGGLMFFSGQFDPFMELVGYRLSLDTGSGGYKLETFSKLMTSIDQFVIFGSAITRDFCDGCLSPQDLGLWSTFVSGFGIPVTSILIFLLLRNSFRVSAAVAVLASFVLAGKYDFYHPVVWIFIGFVLNSRTSVPLESEDKNPKNGVMTGLTYATSATL